MHTVPKEGKKDEVLETKEKGIMKHKILMLGRQSLFPSDIIWSIANRNAVGGMKGENV